jgi:hypothetical protein
MGGNTQVFSGTNEVGRITLMEKRAFRVGGCVAQKSLQERIQFAKGADPAMIAN